MQNPQPRRDKDRKRDRDYYAHPRYLLVCANGECGLSLPTRIGHFNERCPRCGCAMNCMRAD